MPGRLEEQCEERPDDCQPGRLGGGSQYQIIVSGRIDPAWCDRLEGMTVRMATLEAGSLFATLQGELRDQAALAGVLNTLHELQRPVLSVLRLHV